MKNGFRDGEISFEELNDLYQESESVGLDALRRVEDLTRKNKQMTMDLIMIAATLGAEPDMNKVLERVHELLDREAAYKSLMNIG